ncbi:MAG: hypothetical protein J07HN6_02136 [Halonotius sp. J07HN6]|nr:MAG: hypothetical protein J07HN6_02136 [Halonotius sp. J07HN6]
MLGDGVQRLAGLLRFAFEGELDGAGQRELRVGAPAAVGRVKLLGQLAGDVFLDLWTEVVGRRRLVVQPARNPAGLGPLLIPDLADAVDDAPHAIGAEIGRAGQQFAARREKRGGRKPTHVVAFPDRRSAVDIDTDRHEAIVDVGGDAWLAVGAGVHLVAVSTPRRRQREQDRCLVGRGVGERVGAPRPPLDLCRCPRRRCPRLVHMYAGRGRRLSPSAPLPRRWRRFRRQSEHY